MMRLLFICMALLCLTAPASAQTNVGMSVMRSYTYDLVMLFPGGAQNPNEGLEVRGSESYAVIHQGARYLFASAETKDLFVKNPQWYLPGGDGLCLLGWHRRATGAPHKGELPPTGDPRARTYAVGRWYFHGGKGAEREFEKDPYAIEKSTAEAMAWRAKKLQLMSPGKPGS